MESCFGITWIDLILAQKSQDLGKFTVGDFNNLGLIDKMLHAYCKITGDIFSKKILPFLRPGFKFSYFSILLTLFMYLIFLDSNEAWKNSKENMTMIICKFA